jgi:nucleoside-diphosphate-sugar epimerase
MVTCIVIGAGGTLGTALCRELEVFGKVERVGRKNFRIDHLQNILDGLIGEVIVVNLAWPISKPNFRTSADNTDFLRECIRIFSKLQKHDIRIVSIGSILEAGSIQIVSDEIVPNPQDLYAESKYHLHQYLKKVFPETHKWVRIANQVSAFDAPFKLAPLLLSSKNFEITLTGPKNQLDLIHVQDVATALVRIILNFESFPKEVVVGVGRAIEVQELAQLFNSRNIQFDLNSKPIFSRSEPIALRSSGWVPRYLTSTDLFNCLQLELQREGEKFDFVSSKPNQEH